MLTVNHWNLSSFTKYMYSGNCLIRKCSVKNLLTRNNTSLNKILYTYVYYNHYI